MFTINCSDPTNAARAPPPNTKTLTLYVIVNYISFYRNITNSISSLENSRSCINQKNIKFLYFYKYEYIISNSSVYWTNFNTHFYSIKTAPSEVLTTSRIISKKSWMFLNAHMKKIIRIINLLWLFKWRWRWLLACNFLDLFLYFACNRR